MSKLFKSKEEIVYICIKCNGNLVNLNGYYDKSNKPLKEDKAKEIE